MPLISLFRLLVASLGACLLSSPGFATAQYPEEVLINGKLERMMATPLEEYWNDARPKPRRLEMSSTALWRGYIGTWKIEDDRLWLLKLERQKWTHHGEMKRERIPFRSVLKVKSEKPLLADWFSGVLRIARGEQLAYVHMGFGSIYAEDEFIFIERGRVIGRRVVQNDASKLTSDVDLSWRELGRMTEGGGVKVSAPDETADDGGWLTLGEILKRWQKLTQSRQEFRTRGIFFPQRLWFPPQQWMEDATFLLELPELDEMPATGGAVEVLGTLIPDNESGPAIRVREIKVLPPGAPLQRQLVPEQG